MDNHHIYSEKFTSILNNLFHGVLLMEENGTILEFNKASLALLQKNAESVEGAFLGDLIPENYKNKFEAYFKNCLNLQTKNYGKFEVNFFLDNDDLRILEIDSNQNFLSEEDDKMYTICIINDITQRKKLEKELEIQKKSKEAILEKLEREQELNDMKSRFISIASHEFRTPLAGILSSVDLTERYLKMDMDVWKKFAYGAKVDSHVSKIKASINTLTATLNQFLSLGQLEEGKIEYHKQKFNLKQALQSYIDEFRAQLKEGQKINFTFKSEEETVDLDKNIFRHVMDNLLSNAVKYTPQHKQIYVVAFVDEYQIQITVRDEGMGIPDQDQKNLFRRFFRAKNVTNLQGTGLGLNIVMKYVKLMNGEITFVSKENIGTAFKLSFVKKDSESENIDIKDLV
ncbi:ATP-binding protein [Wenyingzhuangia sp. IMCC45533]